MVRVRIQKLLTSLQIFLLQSYFSCTNSSAEAMKFEITLDRHNGANNTYHHFNQPCQDYEHCKFNPLENEAKEVLYFECDEDVSVCQCRLNNSYVNLHRVYNNDLGYERGCFITQNGPCGETNKIKVQCGNSMQCTKGRCSDPERSPRVVPANGRCIDDTECGEGFRCRFKKNEGYIRRCVLINDNDAEFEHSFLRECKNDKDCLFQNNFTRDISIRFQCVKYHPVLQQSLCLCNLSLNNVENETEFSVYWDPSAEKCNTGINRPCGKYIGLTVYCNENLECKHGRCRDVSKIKTASAGAPCVDDLDCKPGLICDKVLSDSQEFRRYVCSNSFYNKINIISIIIMCIFSQFLVQF